MIPYSRLILVLCSLSVFIASGQTPWQGKFEQLGPMLPTPNEYRTGSGSPGPDYWQQQADYVITAELNDETQSLVGSETITYSNNSPDVLTYLWLQLDQNLFDKESNTPKTKTSSIKDSVDAKAIASDLNLNDFTGGYNIKSVKNANGTALSYFINATMMRVNLPQPLKPGEKFSFNIEWNFNINDRMAQGGRSGYEYFPEDKNYIYTIAQWFPRMCVYDDYVGWQNKQFLGRSEFATVFGNYKVRVTVPADHIMAATGVLQNAKEVLSPDQYAKFEKAKNSFDAPIVIATQEEALQREKGRSKEKKTWEFHAEDVRDFAFATSRKFIWDAQAVSVGDRTPLAMSFYPKEGNPLWERESTKAVKNTIITYSKYTIDYPYPVAISVHTADIGMEYPMICFNFGRPNKDGSYSDFTKWRMIGVIVHEVGHNFFPMIINNDERETTWMDEGINSFVQYLTQVENYKDMPKRRGHPEGIVPYMRGDKNSMRPLMTSGEQVVQIGDEQYNKAATALNILRETVMGPELFDTSFKEYAQRWAFKHPKPADFFRTMEDASAVDLDWFWRGWFYTTDNVDISVDNVRWLKIREENAAIENKSKNVKSGDLTSENNAINSTDFSSGPQPFSLIPTDGRLYGEFLNRIDDQAVVESMKGKNFYEVTLSNQGGLVMPVIIEWTYADGSKETERLPAEIWRTNEQQITKVFVKDKEVVNLAVDPMNETADINTRNNMFPKVEQPSKFDQFKNKGK